MSTSPSPILSAEQRAWQYWFDDGLPTLVAGVGCLFAGLFFAYDHSQGSTLLSIAIAVTGLLVYVAVLLFQRQIIEWLKLKITYPRTGYAQPPYFAEEAAIPFDLLALSMEGTDAKRPADIERLHKYRKQRLLLTAAVVAAVTLAMMFIRSRWICALAGVVMALALWLWGRKVQQLSWVIVGGFPFVGFYLTIFVAARVHGIDRVAYFLFAAGALFVIDGVLTLLRYLRNNPGPAPIQP